LACANGPFVIVCFHQIVLRTVICFPRYKHRERSTPGHA
jgi:hypothetical protein